MQPNPTVPTDPPPPDIDPALADELRFLAGWKAGAEPFLGAILRVRQLRRAHPWVLDQ